MAQQTCYICGETHSAYTFHICKAAKVTPNVNYTWPIPTMPTGPDNYKIYWNQLRRIIERRPEGSVSVSAITQMMDDLEGADPKTKGIPEKESK